MRRALTTEELLRKRVAKNVRALRQAAGLTLKRAAEQAEMHWRHWQKVEAAQVNITLQTLLKLGQPLMTEPSTLLSD